MQEKAVGINDTLSVKLIAIMNDKKILQVGGKWISWSRPTVIVQHSKAY